MDLKHSFPQQVNLAQIKGRIPQGKMSPGGALISLRKNMPFAVLSKGSASDFIALFFCCCFFGKGATDLSSVSTRGETAGTWLGRLLLAESFLEDGTDVGCLYQEWQSQCAS